MLSKAIVRIALSLAAAQFLTVNLCDDTSSFSMTTSVLAITFDVTTSLEGREV